VNTTPAHAQGGHPAPHRNRTRLSTLWFGLFGAPAAWSLQELINSALASHACFPAGVPRAEPLYAQLKLWLLLVSALALVMGIAALLTAHHAWRLTAGEHAGRHHRTLEVGEGRTRFMALSGMIVAAVFVVNIVLNGLAVLLANACG
jgi:hypothetical protein